MRLKQNKLKTFCHKPAITVKDNEGNAYTEYGEAVSFEAEMWTAGGKMQTEMHGIRLHNIRNLRIDGNYREVSSKNGRLSYELECGAIITVNDGICINVQENEEPDYKVIAIYPYSHLTLEVERL